jgi:transcription elongation factor SPT5
MSSSEEISGLNQDFDDSDDEPRLKKRPKQVTQRKKEPAVKKREADVQKTKRRQDSDEDSIELPKRKSKGRASKREASEESYPFSDKSEKSDFSDEEEEADSDDYDDDEENPRRHKSAHRKGKKRRNELNNYFDVEASEDEEPEHYVSKEERKRLREAYRRKDTNNDIFNRINKASVDDIVHDYDKRAKDYDQEIDDAVEESAILPTHRDPKLFAVRCKIGFEREAAVSLLRKYFDLRDTPNELFIISASAADKISGSIFIEAFQEIHVRQACDGLLALNKEAIKLIPAKEAHLVFTPDPRNEVKVKVGDFVRVNRGLYQNDLALIEQFDDDSNGVILKLVPRLARASGEVDEAMEKDNMRPPPRLFNPDEHPDAKELERLNVQKKAYMYKNQRFENGFLLKKFHLNFLDNKNLLPTYEEVQIFQNAESDPRKREKMMQNLSMATDQSRRLHKHIEKGDEVKIVAGDMLGFTGKVIEINNEAIKVDFSMHPGFSEPVLVHPSELVKLFKIGDQVEILTGRHKGLSGTVIKLDDKMAHLITDDNKEEIMVLITDIKRGKVKSVLNLQKKSKSEELSKYDLVSLNDGKTVGLVLSIYADSITLLDSDNFVSNQPKIKIASKFTRPFNVTNCHNQNIHAKCTVKVLGGVNRDSLALVLHVYKNKVFVLDQSKTFNGGVFVEDANNCYVLESQAYDNSRNLARFNNPIFNNMDNETQLDGRSTNGRYNQNQKQPNKNVRVNLIGQKKKVVKGEFKGYEGIIQSINDNKARFELSARNKVISIPLDHLNINLEDKDAIMNPTQPTSRTPMHRTSTLSHYNPSSIATPVYNPEHYIG